MRCRHAHLDVRRALDRTGVGLELGNQKVAGLVDAALDVDGVGTRSDVLQAKADELPGEHAGSGGAVTGAVVGAAGHLLDELCSRVFDGVLQLDGACNGHAVVDDLSCISVHWNQLESSPVYLRDSVALLEHDVASTRTERDADSIGHLVDAVLQLLA